jgi:hypothetical protein
MTVYYDTKDVDQTRRQGLGPPTYTKDPLHLYSGFPLGCLCVTFSLERDELIQRRVGL